MSCASAVPAELEAIFLPFIARFWPLWRLSLQKDWPAITHPAHCSHYTGGNFPSSMNTFLTAHVMQLKSMF
jgi:hypothetical protein